MQSNADSTNNTWHAAIDMHLVLRWVKAALAAAVTPQQSGYVSPGGETDSEESSQRAASAVTPPASDASDGDTASTHTTASTRTTDSTSTTTTASTATTAGTTTSATATSVAAAASSLASDSAHEGAGRIVGASRAVAHVIITQLLGLPPDVRVGNHVLYSIDEKAWQDGVTLRLVREPDTSAAAGSEGFATMRPDGWVALPPPPGPLLRQAGQLLVELLLLPVEAPRGAPPRTLQLTGTAAEQFELSLLCYRAEGVPVWDPSQMHPSASMCLAAVRARASAAMPPGKLLHSLGLRASDLVLPEATVSVVTWARLACALRFERWVAPTHVFRIASATVVDLHDAGVPQTPRTDSAGAQPALAGDEGLSPEELGVVRSAARWTDSMLHHARYVVSQMTDPGSASSDPVALDLRIDGKEVTIVAVEVDGESLQGFCGVTPTLYVSRWLLRKAAKCDVEFCGVLAVGTLLLHEATHMLLRHAAKKDGNFGSSDLDRLLGHWPSTFAESLRDDDLAAAAKASQLHGGDGPALESGCVLERYLFGMRPNFLALSAVDRVTKVVIGVQLARLMHPVSPDVARRLCTIILGQLPKGPHSLIRFADIDGPPTGRDQRPPVEIVGHTAGRGSDHHWYRRDALPVRSAVCRPATAEGAHPVHKRVKIVG